MKAEADAADRAARLRVYAEQLAEYAADKARTADALLQQAATLAAALAAAPPEVSGAVQQLQQQLEEAAAEAKHFAEQQRADVERSKRSSQQVRPPPVAWRCMGAGGGRLWLCRGMHVSACSAFVACSTNTLRHALYQHVHPPTHTHTHA